MTFSIVTFVPFADNVPSSTYFMKNCTAKGYFAPTNCKKKPKKFEYALK